MINKTYSVGELEQTMSNILDWITNKVEKYIFTVEQKNIDKSMSDDTKYSVSVSDIPEQYVCIDIIELYDHADYADNLYESEKRDD